MKVTDYNEGSAAELDRAGITQYADLSDVLDALPTDQQLHRLERRAGALLEADNR